MKTRTSRAVGRLRLLAAFAFVTVFAVACGAGGSPGANETSPPEPAAGEATPAEPPQVETADAAAGEDTGNGAAAADELSFVVPQAIQYLPVFAAIEGGFFEEHGIDASISEFQDVQAARTVFLAGEVDVVVGASIGNTALYETVPITHVAGLFTGDPQQIVLSTELEDQLEAGNIEELRGLTLATTTPGSGADTTLRALLSRNGITPGEDAEVINNEGLAGAYSALAEGRVDGMIAAEPFTSTAVNDGAGFVFMDLAAAPEAWPVGETIPSVVFSMQNTFYESNSDLTDRMVSAVVDTHIAIQDDPDLLLTSAGDVMADMDDEFAREVVANVLPRYSPVISEDGWELAMDLWVETDAIENRIDYEEIVATEYQDEWARFPGDE